MDKEHITNFPNLVPRAFLFDVGEKPRERGCHFSALFLISHPSFLTSFSEIKWPSLGLAYTKPISVLVNSG